MPIERIDVLDHKAFGEMVAGWSLDRTTRPRTLDDLKAACADILRIPDRITKLKYVDVDLKTLAIRVPNKAMVAESVERFRGAQDSSEYPWPAFYEDLTSESSPPALDTLYSRIADYTIAQCL